LNEQFNDYKKIDADEEINVYMITASNRETIYLFM